MTNDASNIVPTAARYRDASVGGCVAAVVEQRPDGTTLLRSTEALQPYPTQLTDRLEH